MKSTRAAAASTHAVLPLSISTVRLLSRTVGGQNCVRPLRRQYRLGFDRVNRGGTRGWENGAMAVRKDCRHYSSRTLPTGEQVERCRLDVNQAVPFACPEGCVFFE